MITLYDYLPSQNAWKVRQLLHELSIPHTVQTVSIFEGAGQAGTYRKINPWGAVPAIRLEDGRVLSESNAILWYLSQGSALIPADPFAQAKVLQWMSFEADYVQASVGSLQYWTLTGKLAARDPALVDGKRAVARRALSVLEEAFAANPFIAGDCSIADISLYAYASRAEIAGLATHALPHFTAWLARMADRPGGLAPIYTYEIDPHSFAELP